MVRVAPFRPWRARLIQTELPERGGQGARQDRPHHARPGRRDRRRAGGREPLRPRPGGAGRGDRRGHGGRRRHAADRRRLGDHRPRGRAARRHRHGRRRDPAFRHAGRPGQPPAARAASPAARCLGCPAAAARPSATASTGCWSGWPRGWRSPAGHHADGRRRAAGRDPLAPAAARGPDAARRHRRGSPALVLAAGQSRRMGGPNKLLLPVAGVPMVRHVVEAALASRAAPGDRGARAPAA